MGGVGKAVGSAYGGKSSLIRNVSNSVDMIVPCEGRLSLDLAPQFT
jgi:hypothetical protein